MFTDKLFGFFLKSPISLSADLVHSYWMIDRELKTHAISILKKDHLLWAMLYHQLAVGQGIAYQHVTNLRTVVTDLRKSFSSHPLQEWRPYTWGEDAALAFSSAIRDTLDLHCRSLNTNLFLASMLTVNDSLLHSLLWDAPVDMIVNEAGFAALREVSPHRGKTYSASRCLDLVNKALLREKYSKSTSRSFVPYPSCFANNALLLIQKSRALSIRRGGDCITDRDLLTACIEAIGIDGEKAILLQSVIVSVEGGDGAGQQSFAMSQVGQFCLSSSSYHIVCGSIEIAAFGGADSVKQEHLLLSACYSLIGRISGHIAFDDIRSLVRDLHRRIFPRLPETITEGIYHTSLPIPVPLIRLYLEGRS